MLNVQRLMKLKLAITNGSLGILMDLETEKNGLYCINLFLPIFYALINSRLPEIKAVNVIALFGRD